MFLPFINILFLSCCEFFFVLFLSVLSFFSFLLSVVDAAWSLRVCRFSFGLLLSFAFFSNTRCNTCLFDATCHNCLCILCATIHFVYALKSKLKEQYYFSIECCFSQFFLAHTISVENVHIITTIIIREKPTAHSLYVCVCVDKIFVKITRGTRS